MRLSEPMEDMIQVRIARDEKRRLIDAARQFGMTLSDFVRKTAAAKADNKEAA